MGLAPPLTPETFRAPATGAHPATGYPPPMPAPAAAPPPERDGNEVRILRDVTFVLVAINLVVAIHKIRLGTYGELLFDREYALSLEGVRGGAWWQFLTYQFLHAGATMFRHGGWLHLVMNVLLLDSLGPVLETTLGRLRFLVLYLVSGALGGLVHLVGAALSPSLFGHPVVGASAGLCGLLAALGTIYAEDRIQARIFFVIPIVLKAKYLLLVAMLLSAAGVVFPFGQVAHLAHLGGLVGGLWCVNWLKVQTPLQLGDD